MSSLLVSDVLDQTAPTASEIMPFSSTPPSDRDIIDDMEDAEANGTAMPDPVNPHAEFMTPEQAAFFAKRDKEDWDFVQLAIETLDPKDALKKHSKLGKEALKRLSVGKASLHKGSWNPKKDIGPIFEKLETMIRMESCVKSVQLDKLVRVHLLVEAIRPFAPKVESLRYGVVYNKLLPLLVFDAEELTGEIKTGWHVWLKEFVVIMLGSEPLNKDAIAESMEAHQKSLDQARLAKQDPEKAAIAAEKTAARLAAKPRTDAIKAVGSVIDKALTDANIDENDLISILDKNLIAHGKTLPANPGMFDPKNATVSDCRMLALAMMAHGKHKEMRALIQYLGQMLISESTAETVAA